MTPLRAEIARRALPLASAFIRLNKGIPKTPYPLTVRPVTTDTTPNHTPTRTKVTYQDLLEKSRKKLSPPEKESFAENLKYFVSHKSDDDDDRTASYLNEIFGSFKDIQDMAQRCFDDMTKGKKADKGKVKAFILQALMGAGKTKISERIIKENPDMIPLDLDDMLLYLRNFDILQKAVGDKWGKLGWAIRNGAAQYIVKKFLENGFSINPHTTGSRTKDYIAFAKEYNCDIKVYILDISPEVAALQALNRYIDQITNKETGRFIGLEQYHSAIEGHDKVIKNVLERHPEIEAHGIFRDAQGNEREMRITDFNQFKTEAEKTRNITAEKEKEVFLKRCDDIRLKANLKSNLTPQQHLKIEQEISKIQYAALKAK